MVGGVPHPTRQQVVDLEHDIFSLMLKQTSAEVPEMIGVDAWMLGLPRKPSRFLDILHNAWGMCFGIQYNGKR